MPVTPLPSLTLVSLPQRLNAFSPMRVTLSGIVTSVRLVQSETAQSPMPVTGQPPNAFAMDNAPEYEESSLVMVTLCRRRCKCNSHLSGRKTYVRRESSQGRR